jgi:hypothetical protein
MNEDDRGGYNCGTYHVMSLLISVPLTYAGELEDNFWGVPGCNARPGLFI